MQERTSALLQGTTASLPAQQNPYYVYLARLSPGSRPAMQGALRLVASLASSGQLQPDCFPWHLLRYQYVQALRSRLTEIVSTRTGKPLGPATVNRHLAALRGVLKEAWRLGLMSAEELARATDLEVVRGKGVLRGRCLSTEEVERLFQACAADPGPAGPRDATILALGLGAGLRRAEIAGLDLSDVSLDQELLRVLGKGHKVREVPIHGGTVAAVQAWLCHRATAPGPLVSLSSNIILPKLESSSVSFLRLASSLITSPILIGSNPITDATFTIVDFPAPDIPVMQTISFLIRMKKRPGYTK